AYRGISLLSAACLFPAPHPPCVLSLFWQADSGTEPVISVLPAALLSDDIGGMYSPARRGIGPWEASYVLLVAIHAFAPLVAFLGLDRQGGDRARLQPLEGNRLAGLLAVAVGAVFDTLQCSVDFGDQLALSIAGPKLDRPVSFR